MAARYPIVSCYKKDVCVGNHPEVRLTVNKMFECLVWYPRCVPMMILNDRVTALDIIARTILDEPFVKEPIIGAAVHIQFTDDQLDSGSPRDNTIYFKVRESSPQIISCWNFIEWLNGYLENDPYSVVENIEILKKEHVLLVSVKIITLQ